MEQKEILSKNHEYFIIRNKTKLGPFSFKQILYLYNTKEITENTYVWRMGLEKWILISQLEDIKEYLKNSDVKSKINNDFSKNKNGLNVFNISLAILYLIILYNIVRPENTKYFPNSPSGFIMLFIINIPLLFILYKIIFNDFEEFMYELIEYIKFAIIPFYGFYLVLSGQERVEIVFFGKFLRCYKMTIFMFLCILFFIIEIMVFSGKL